ncbi:MAG: 3-oxoacyl-ACP synthase, partial [Gemmatimonadales bacterium]
MKRPIVEMVGSAHYVPAKVLSNHDLEKMLDTSDDWIRERTGIRERHVAAPGESLTSMAKCAASRLFQETGTGPEDIDALVVATASWDRLLPSAACDIQAAIGAVNAAAFDVGAACAGYLYALQVAEGMVAAGQAENVLVIGAERLTS